MAAGIASGRPVFVTKVGWQWLVIISCVISTTMHVQDLKDEAGDRARARRSAPIVLGDAVARWTIAIPVLFWSFFLLAHGGN